MERLRVQPGTCALRAIFSDESGCGRLFRWFDPKEAVLSLLEVGRGPLRDEI